MTGSGPSRLGLSVLNTICFIRFHSTNKKEQTDPHLRKLQGYNYHQNYWKSSRHYSSQTSTNCNLGSKQTTVWIHPRKSSLTCNNYLPHGRSRDATNHQSKSLKRQATAKKTRHGKTLNSRETLKSGITAEIIAQAKDCRKPIYTITMAIQKAFDVVSDSHLVKKL